MEENGFRQKLTYVSLTVTLAVSVLLFSVMLVYAKDKTVILDDVYAGDETRDTVSRPDAYKFMVSTKNENDGTVGIVIPANGVNENKTGVYVDYGTRHMYVSFSDVGDGDRLDIKPYGNFMGVESAVGEYTGRDLIYDFTLSGDYIPTVSFAGDSISIRLGVYKNTGKKIVILDPFHGGSESGTVAGAAVEKDIVMNIAREVSALTKDKPYIVILTRDGDVTLSESQRLYTVSVTNADAYLGLDLSSDVDDIKTFGMLALFNEDFYKNGLEGAVLSDTVLKSVCTAAGDRALGVFPDEGDSILKSLNIPGTVLHAGFISNQQEAALLTDKEYTEKIAEGIVSALDELFPE